jgi:hypothetical protein
MKLWGVDHRQALAVGLILHAARRLRRAAIELIERPEDASKIAYLYWLASSEGPTPSPFLRPLKIRSRTWLAIWLLHLRFHHYNFPLPRRNLYVPASPKVKILALRQYARRYNLKTFVETGTYLGDTIAALAPNFLRCFTIEIEPMVYERCRRRLESFDNVECILADSSLALPAIVQGLKGDALFWLDGHASGGETFNSGKGPLISELTTIYSEPSRRHVVLIDDARGHDIESIRRFCESRAQIDIHNDIIRLTPTK